jgi:ABC-type nitrate/sulfonate/bicarbonate transport system substrate-binding protein
MDHMRPCNATGTLSLCAWVSNIGGRHCRRARGSGIAHGPTEIGNCHEISNQPAATRSGNLCRYAALAVAAHLAMAISWIAPARAESKIVEGFVSNGALQWPEYVANELGWFRENGVSVDLLSVGPGAAQQLAAGSLNIGYSGFPDFVRATNQGAPVKIVINAVNQPPYAVYAKSAIKSIADLKGKTVSIGGIKDVTLIYMEAFIASAGLKAADLDFVYAKATQDRLAALMSGGADAAILIRPPRFARQRPATPTWVTSRLT